MKLPKAYQPSLYESDIYALWESSGAFKPKKLNNKNYFSLVMPPPNANSDLHIGYELTAAIEDIFVRYHRLRGESTLMVPGADHAGFETWVVYEKRLNSEGKSRFDFTREQLYSQVWDFVAENKSNFEKQLRTMGVSCDWDLFTFTLDDKVVAQAYRLFKQMWDDKLIYRGERLVNFCTFHGTSFADIEVDYKREKGKLYYVDYPLSDGSGALQVATTRPETMYGDTAVAVNPNDKRYLNYIGKTVTLPISGRKLPVIADGMVDKKFGTGAVKITPAHDHNDFEVAGRHSLPMISVITDQGTMIDSSDIPEFIRNQPVKVARELTVTKLEEIGLLKKSENITHSVGHCYKCNTVIEPLLKEQWFVKMRPLADRAIKSLDAGEIKFLPTAKLAQARVYLEGIKDWNISRQIPWGIPIPAFYNVEDENDWIFDDRVDKETIEVSGKTYKRDSDVFDTWFSSGQWPFVTLDYPKGHYYENYYPLSLMNTGGEILYPWVCRMIMLGLYATDKVPFKDVYIHGYVLAEDGSKMSKSVGNVVAPIPLIELYGSDALRMAIISGRSPGVNRGFDRRRVEEARNFANKLWNIARFVEDKVGDDFNAKQNPTPSSTQDHWIMSRLSSSITKIASELDSYRLAEAYELLYHLVWDDLADWYVEATKVSLNQGVLAHSLETVLKLIHPFAPFLSETIWQTLKWEKSMLIRSNWPEPINFSAKEAKEFEHIKNLISEIRLINNITGSSKTKIAYQSSKVIEENLGVIKALSGLSSIEQTDSSTGLKLTSFPTDVWLDIDAHSKAKFMNELKKQVSVKEVLAKNLQARLKNSEYLRRAPKQIVQETKAQLAEAEHSLEHLSNQYESFFRSN
ncbi:MAG TPA: valine--tRNA ligase [Candidatus Saccharimonadales bacterium]|nr:valine--tRNA ligase [Candidatus Saccharimonadales bacterium]